MDIGDLCDRCEDAGCKNCENCSLGNPCIGCTDYDEKTHQCASNGACADAEQEDE